MIYMVKIPLTYDMCAMDYVVSDTPTRSWYEEALWHYNHSRDHDGLRPLKALPKGTTHELFKLDQPC